MIHVLVALCDNKTQGIRPVPKAIGNGDDPEHNLYWGASLGVKSWFSASPSWQLVSSTKGKAPIMERLVFHDKAREAYLVADAYRGSEMKEALTRSFRFTRGLATEKLGSVAVGGSAGLVIFVGHNGLMDTSIPLPTTQEARSPDVAVLCCKSRTFFSPHLVPAEPILLTNDSMAPEAYVVDAAINGWLARESAEAVARRAAVAYNKHQRCGSKGAWNLFKPISPARTEPDKGRQAHS